MQSIKSAIFNLLFSIWTLTLCVVLIPLTWLGNKRATIAGKVWAHGTIFMLKILCGINHRVEGIENIPDTPFVIASKHQSAWDTVIFFTLIRHPVFVFKKELMNIPFFGSFLKRMGMVAVDRKGGASALKGMLKEVKGCLEKGMSPIIFPEGTRTKPGEIVKYHPGIASIYNDNSIDALFLPVALDSGKFWAKDSFLKKPGTITIKFLKPIKKGMDRKEFMKKLQKQIENG